MPVWPAIDPSLMHAADSAGVLEKLASSRDGLTSADAAARLASCGRNRLEVRREQAVWQTFAAQFKSPLVLIPAAGGSAVRLCADGTGHAVRDARDYRSVRTRQ